MSSTAESWTVNRSTFQNQGSCQTCSNMYIYENCFLFSRMTLPHLFPFSSQEGQLKASDVYFPPEVTRTLLYGPNAHCVTYSCTQEQLRANILKMANFFFYCNIQPQETGANKVYFQYCFLPGVSLPG